MEYEIEPEQIVPALSNTVAGLPTDAILVCEGVRIAKRVKGKTIDVACDHPVHGCHPKNKDMYDKLNEKYFKILAPYLVTDEKKCPKCKGEKWLFIQSDEARKLITMVKAFNMFKGVIIKSQQKLNIDEVRGTVTPFLNGTSASSPGGAQEDTLKAE
jgi:hypothetical protein